MQELYSLNRLSVELQRDRRALGRALEDLPADYERPQATKQPTQEDCFGEPPDENTEPTMNGHRTIKLWRLHRVVAHLYEGKRSGLDLEQERALLAKAQRERIERDELLRGNEYVRVEVAQAAWMKSIQAARAALLVIPSKHSETLTRCKDRIKVFQILTDAIHEAMSNISAGMETGNRRTILAELLDQLPTLIGHELELTDEAIDEIKKHIQAIRDEVIEFSKEPNDVTQPDQPAYTDDERASARRKRTRREKERTHGGAQANSSDARSDGDAPRA